MALDKLGEHQVNLDAAYRGLQKVFKALTYEHGRLRAEADLEELVGSETTTRLEAMAERVHDIGMELRALARAERGEPPDAPEAKVEPQP